MKSYLDHRGEPRIVITGMGAITPIGHSVDESWDSLLNGRSGIAPITQFDAHDMTSKIAGEINDFNPKAYMSHKEARRMARSSQLAVATAKQAIEDAHLDVPLVNSERFGLIIGTGMGGFEMAAENLLTYMEQGLSRVKPFGLVSCLPNMVAHHVSVMAKCHGPISTIVAACATGAQTIGEAAELIRRGRADIMLAGGVEGLVHVASIGGFCAMRVLATKFNDDPQRASRPFNKDRDGFVLSEGSATVVLERMDQAIGRGAHIHAELVGHANCADAFHMTAPDPKAAGPIRAMRWAIEDANLQLDDIDYISAHATSTILNDITETLAIKKLFGDRAYQIPISGVKALTGHALGGSGAIEATMAVKTLQTGILPPTWNYETPDPACDLDYIPNEPRHQEVTHILSNSFGMGGQNACLVLKKYTGT